MGRPDSITERYFCHHSSQYLQQHHVCHRPSLCLSPPRHGCLEEHEARHRASHQPHPHLRCQVHRSWGCHRGCCWVRSWYRLCLRVSYHWLRQEPLSQAAAVLLRHLGLCPVRGYGSVLFDDGLPPPLRFLNEKNNEPEPGVFLVWIV